MTENELAKIVVDVAYEIHTRLGPRCFTQVGHDHENRAEGPAVCLAQPNGLGPRTIRTAQGQRPDCLPHDERKWPGRWPSRFLRLLEPSPLGWAR